MRITLKASLWIVIACIAHNVLAAQTQPKAVAQPEGLAAPGYVLGPRDQITVWAREVEELTHTGFMIDSTGFVDLPMVGRVHAAGMTVEQLEQELVQKLKTFLIRPQVVVNVTAFRTVAVSVMGAVVSPGIRELKDRQTLAEAILQSGGLKPEASPLVRVTRKLERGRIPLESAKDDSSGKFSVAEINLKSAMGSDPSENIEMAEDDLINIAVLPVVYITGDVTKPGGIPSDNIGGVSVLKALSQAGGLTRTANPQKARIIRPILDGKKQAELPIDVKKILQGRAPDVQLLPSDVLFIPGSVSKQAAMKALETALSIGTTGALWVLRP